MRKLKNLFLIAAVCLPRLVVTQDQVDFNLTEENSNSAINNTVNSDKPETNEVDDLESLKEDIGEVVFDEDKNSSNQKTEASSNEDKQKSKMQNNVSKGEEKVEIIADQLNQFDVGDEEKKLLMLAKRVQGKISTKEWDDLAIKAKIHKYEVQKGDYLWKISKKLFGSGFYYSKIWSLNPQITNPHEIEPGTVLAFDTGDAESFPNVQVGQFEDDSFGHSEGGLHSKKINDTEAGKTSSWLQERQKLIDQGVYFQFASEETYEDLENLEKLQKSGEYQKYDPPLSDIAIKEPSDEYDNSGFDKKDRVSFKFKEGFFLNTFVTNNPIVDLGVITGSQKESLFIHKNDTIFVKFQKSATVKLGDLYSVFAFGGEIRHGISDRAGFKYTTTAEIQVVGKKDDVWECLVTDQSGLVQRNDHITMHIPKITKLSKTFGRRLIESAVIGSYRESLVGNSFGDVVYLDRGRADGVEIGNVFDIYTFIDPGTGKKISAVPSNHIGELLVINLTDNFSTALVIGSKNEIALGSLALSRTQEEEMRRSKLKNRAKLVDVNNKVNKTQDELDISLNLDDVGSDILNRADKIQLTEDELEELEKKEREKSVIKENERDEKELDRLESEIASAETTLNEAKVDEDKFLEQQNLEEIEKKTGDQDPNGFESLDEIETDIKRKYLDEDINNKENPYGLTEFDLEEVDELLNTDFKK